MDSLLADNFEISSMTTGWSMNKEDFLKTIPKQVIKWQEITDVEVTMDGDKANSKVDISMAKTFEGKDHSGDYEVYSVWVNNGGNWQLIERKIKFLKP
ncbi:MAG: nuclear transport factor 2 family protein, partial [Thermodesulfobacteriota bacterium]